MAETRRAAPGFTFLLGAGATVLVLAGIREAGSIVGPVFLAVIFTIAVSPLRGWLKRAGAPGWVVFAAPLATVLLVLLALLAAIGLSAAKLASMLPSYTGEFDALLATVTARLSAWGVDPTKVRETLTTLDPERVLPIVQGFLSSAIGVSSAVVLIVITLVGLALDSMTLDERIAELRHGHRDLADALGRFADDTKRYIIVSAVFGLLMAAIDTISLTLLGVPLPLLWGFVSFLANFIPTVGFVLGLIPPALLGLLDQGPWTMLGVIGAYCASNFVTQSLILPRFLGKAVGLSVALTMLSLVVWGWLLGPLGAVLAVPLTMLAKTLLLDADPGKRWVSRLLGGSV
ncbi:AI-2E family transporter [Actinomadura flavalba]|uniref:AI-2E family transporter n=1 Tax=Actinomadura flavalba TaxID=1120938 RepID=UPI0003601E22|nr:AI-2E family transporter [Actinomadura flavalba]